VRRPTRLPYSDVLHFVDDGTYLKVKFEDTTKFQIVKATGNLQVAGGFDTDTSL